MEDMANIVNQKKQRATGDTREAAVPDALGSARPGNLAM
jgi:hypothetical protein